MKDDNQDKRTIEDKAAILTQEYVSEEAKKHHRHKRNTKFVCSIVILALTIGIAVVGTTLYFNSKSANQESKNKIVEEPYYVVEGEEVNLSDVNADVLISKSGTYTVYGVNDDRQIAINADGEVVLRLSSIQASSANRSLIYNKSTNPLTIEAVDDTQSVITVSGSANAAIESDGPLTFTGNNGVLIIEDNSNNGQGIITNYQNGEEMEDYLTDGNYLIDGGLVVVFSNHDIKQPSTASQPTLTFDNDNTANGTYSVIEIKETAADEATEETQETPSTEATLSNEAVFTFGSIKPFKKVMISSVDFEGDKNYMLQYAPFQN